MKCMAAVLMCLLVAGCLQRVVSGEAPATAFAGVSLCTRPNQLEMPLTTAIASPKPGAGTQGTAAPNGGNDSVTFTVVYDNNVYDRRLQTAWGFACLVETGKSTVLFDTGGDGSILLKNMESLGFNPLQIDAIVLSHIHADHTGGLTALLEEGVRPPVYVPATFPVSFKKRVRTFTALVEVTGPMEILPGIHTSGELGTYIVEQALVVETGHGLVVVTGCAHPGVVEMVRRAMESFGGQVAWVIGGFHLGGTSSIRIEGIIDEFRRLGVQKVAPCHCTGDLARRMFAQAFGAAYFPAGVGWTVSVGGKEAVPLGRP